MRKIFLFVAVALFLVSCGKSYIEGYEELCKETVEQIECASSKKEVLAIMKDFRKSLHDFNEENPEDAQLYMFADNQTGENKKIFERRIKAYNSVNMAFVKKIRPAKE